jgi:RHS repeat-associated protein
MKNNFNIDILQQKFYNLTEKKWGINLNLGRRITMVGTVYFVKMISQRMKFHKHNISVFASLLIIYLLSSYSLLWSECECPGPVYGPGWDYKFVTPPITYAEPGDIVSLIVIAIDPYTSPCCNPGDNWCMCAQLALSSAFGAGWAKGVPPEASDCNTQYHLIQVPFDNPESSNLFASYYHCKGFRLIRVRQYSNPDSTKTDDMDAVNTYTGAFHTADVDYSNSDIEFKRYYNNMRLARSFTVDTLKRWKNPIGIGWQHNYNIYLEEIQQINAGSDTIKGVLIHEGKATNVYKLLDSGNYQLRKGNHANLKKSGSIWRLYKPEGDIYYFGSSGKVDSIVDRNGKKTAFTYSGSYLSQVTGKDNHTLSFSYNSDSLLRWVSITENSNTKKFEYRYSPVTYIFNADSDTFDLMGTYYLTQVLQHYNTGSADSLMSLDKYYYDNHNLSMVAKVFPEDSYTQSDTIWKGNYKKGDRLYIWYDSLGQTIYNEIIEGDENTLLTNDKVTYRAYTKYFSNSSNFSMDSTLTYIYQADAGTGSAHDPYDTTFTPQAPTSNYALRKRDYHNDILGRQIIIENRPDADTTFITRYYKDKDFNDTLAISPDGDTTRYTYESYTLNDTTKYSPKPTKIKYQTGDSTLFYYHAPDNNAPSFFLTDSTFDELGRKTEYYYDNNYNLDSLRYYSRYVAGVGTTNITTDYTYNSKGNLTRIEDPLANSTYFSYSPNDTGAYLTKTRIDFSPSGSGNEDIVTKYKYDTDIGKVDTVIYYRDYPNDSSVVYYKYDAMNRLKETHYPDGTIDGFTYDKRGNLLKKETYVGSPPFKSVHFKIEYEYDAMDHLIKVKEYKNAPGASYDSTIYKYNLNGDLIGFINANDTTGTSTKVKYTYDAGRLLKVAYPDTTTDSLGYYNDGNLRFKRDRREKVVSYVYDDRDRLTKKRYFNTFAQYQGFPDSTPAETLAFSYDKVGNMTSMLDKNGTIGYSYDEMDKVDTLSCYQDILITYEYDVGGNRKRLKVANAATPDTVYLNQTYTSYDEANRLEETVVGTDTFDFDYWDTGQIKKLDYPNGVKEQYKLTSRNFIDIITDSTSTSELYKYDYDYNEVGDRKKLSFGITRVRSPDLTGKISYKYDDLRRITEAEYPRSIYNKTNKYTYDKVGNRLKKIADTDTTEYIYNKRNNQLTGDGWLLGYYYDDNGNLVKFNHPGATDTLFYDFENRLVKFVEKSTTIPPTYDTLWFQYCGMGKRLKKIEKPDGQSPDTTAYSYDGMYSVCEFGGHLDLEYKYIYANGMLLARYNESSADTHYYHHDGLGSVMGLTDESGNVEQSYFYDEFGDSLGSWGPVTNHYLYTGQEYDGSITNLYNLRARYYDMRVGRFVQEDPALSVLSQLRCCNANYLFPQNNNQFLYCLNNPINYIDPLGLFRFHWYKNWGGPGWSGGDWIPDLNKLKDKELKNLVLGGQPTDPVDQCYMIHDFCYADCRLRWENVNSTKLHFCNKMCDWRLSICLSGNTPKSPLSAWPKSSIAIPFFGRIIP